MATDRLRQLRAQRAAQVVEEAPGGGYRPAGALGDGVEVMKSQVPGQLAGELGRLLADLRQCRST
jgi:hypothetical protein